MFMQCDGFLKALLPWLGVNSQFKPVKSYISAQYLAIVNMPFNGTYCISKHALESMNDIFRRERQHPLV